MLDEKKTSENSPITGEENSREIQQVTTERINENPAQEILATESIITQPITPRKIPYYAGRPRILKSVPQAEQLIEEYFQSKPEKPTITGLALFLGFLGRRQLLHYIERETIDDESRAFGPCIQKAISRIEEIHEERMYNSQAPVGSIFWLKNRGWRDTRDITSDGEPVRSVISIVPPEGFLTDGNELQPQVD